MKDKPQRLFCLDLLRGLDIFYLTVCLPFFGWELGARGHLPGWLNNQFQHLLAAFTDFGGPTAITVTDFAQPVFLFITGVSAVFAVPRRLDADGAPTRAFWAHLVKRILLLWTLGCIIRNALTLDLEKFTPYADTLQTIAVGYAGAALSMLIRSLKARLAVPLVLLAAYGVVQATFGDYTRFGNFSRIVDEWAFAKIGCKAKDFCYVLTTVAWASMGALAALVGEIVSSPRSPWQRVRELCFWGVLSVAAGWVLTVWVPQNRYIYTVSFVFVTFGYATLLLTALFIVTDIWKIRRGFGLFIIFGQSSLVAWMLHANPLRYGLKAIADKVVIGFPVLGLSSETQALVSSALVSVFIVLIVLFWRGKTTLIHSESDVTN